MAMRISTILPGAHDFQVLCVAYNPFHGELYSGAQESVIKVWDAVTGQLLRRLTGHKGWVTDLLYVPAARLLFSCSLDHTIKAWTDLGQEVQTIITDDTVHCLGWCTPKKWLIAGGNGELRVYEVDLANAARACMQLRSQASMADRATVTTVALNEPGQSVLQLAMKPLRAPLHANTDIIRSIVCTEQGFIFTVSYDRCIMIYEADRMQSVRRLEKCVKSGLTCAVFDTLNGWLVTGEQDGSFRVWSQEGRCLDTFAGVSDMAASCCVVPLTGEYWCTGKHGALLVYDPRAPADVTAFVPGSRSTLQAETRVTKLLHPHDSDIVVAITRDRSLVVWRHSTASAYRVFKARAAWLETVSVVHSAATNACCIFVGCADGYVQRWDLDSEQNVEVYKVEEEEALHERNVLAALYCPALDALITSAEEGSIRIHWLNMRPEAQLQQDTSSATGSKIPRPHRGTLLSKVDKVQLQRTLTTLESSGTKTLQLHPLMLGGELVHQAEEAQQLGSAKGDSPKPTAHGAGRRRAQARNISFAADAPQMQQGVRLRHAPSSAPGSAQPQHPLALGPGFAHSAAAGEAGESGGAAALGVQPSDVLDVGPSWSNLQHVPSMATGGPAHPMALGAQHAGQGGGLAAAEGRRQQQQHAHQQQHRDGHSSLQCTLQRQTSCAAELPYRQLSRTVTLADTMLATSHSNYMRDDVPASDVVLGHGHRVTGLCLLPPGNVLASVSHDRCLRLWDLQTFRLIKTVKDAHETPLQGIDCSPERMELITCAMDSFAYVWDAREVRTKCALTGHTGEVTQVKWVPWRESWLTCSDDDTIRLWDVEGCATMSIPYKGGAVQTVLVDCANQLLLAAMLDRVIRVYDLGSPQPLMKYEGHTDAVSSIGYLPDKGLYVSGSWDSTLRLWKQPGEQQQRRAREHVRQRRERHAVGAGLYLLKPGKAIVESGFEELTHPVLGPLRLPNSLQGNSQADAISAFLATIGNISVEDRSEDEQADPTGLKNVLAEMDKKLLEDLAARRPQDKPVYVSCFHL
eukprot:jgi/Astpho2/8102/fgenesh1_pg.00120_%23_63_t